MAGNLRATLHEVLNPHEHSGWPARLVEALLVGAITASVVAAVWNTVNDISPDLRLWLGRLSIAAFVVFTAEYLARILAVTASDPAAEETPALALLAYMRSPLGVVDALVVLPQLGHALGWLGPSLPRLAAVLAVLKIARYAPALPLVLNVFRNERRSLLSALTVMLVLLLLAATVMYSLEHDAQPQLFSSIPESCWWAIVTIATVGYGDMFPITPLGRIAAGGIMLLGIAMFAVPAGILATGFAAEIRRRDFVVTWNTVARVPLFSGLDASGIAAIARLLKPQIVPAHYAIVRRGEPATAMFFIMSGEVEVDVQPHPVRLRGGQFFGEIALLRDTQRTATVTAHTETQLLALEAGDFRKLMDQFPEIRQRVIQVAEGRLGGDAKPKEPPPS
jgi:voltage-gated potassium channel